MIYGRQTAALRACTKSAFHGFHPANEPCSYCDPVQSQAVTTKSMGHLYYLHCSDESIVDNWDKIEKYLQDCWEKSAEAEIEFWLRTSFSYPVWHPEARV